MPKIAAELTAMDIKRAAHPGGGRETHYQIAVGGVPGLLLQITATGAKSWVYRTIRTGKRTPFGLGSYPAVSLAEARELAREMRAKIAIGVNPIEEKRAARAALAAESATRVTFAEAFDLWKASKGSGLSDKRRKYFENAFERHIYPHIGKLLVRDITTQDVLRAFAPIWESKTETATKLREKVEAVMTWATISGYRQGDNPARWGGNLKELLAAPHQVSQVEHYPAVALADLPRWYKAISKGKGQASRCLRFAVVTCVRSGEARAAQWREIDLDAGMWTIPASKMLKSGLTHRVALSADAIAILKAQPRGAGADLVFPNKAGKMLSDNALSKLMRDLQEREEKAGRVGFLDPLTHKPAVPHGLRSTFRDWAAETGKDRDMAEIALSHVVGDDTERAYRRSDMFQRRRVLAGQWADAIFDRADNVVQFPERSGLAA